jgi:hypothetical protein
VQIWFGALEFAADSESIQMIRDFQPVRLARLVFFLPISSHNTIRSTSRALFPSSYRFISWHQQEYTKETGRLPNVYVVLRTTKLLHLLQPTTIDAHSQTKKNTIDARTQQLWIE